MLYLLITSGVVCANFGSFGLGPASIYLIGKDRRRFSTMVGNLLAFTGGMAVALCTAGAIFLQYGSPDTYSRLPLWIWSILALFVALHLLRDLLMQVLSATLRIKEVNLLDVVAVAIHLSLLVIVFVFLNAGIAGALIAAAVSEALTVVACFVMVVHYGGRPSTPNLSLLKTSIRYGIKTHLANLMKLLNFRLDAFLIATLIPTGIHATGVYSVATGLAELLLFVPQSIRLSLFPMLAASRAPDPSRLTSASCRQALLLTLIGALGLGVIGYFFIPRLYGTAFRAAIIPLLILLPGVVLESLVRILYVDFNGRGKPGTTIISASVTLVVTIVLDFILIPAYGIAGAAIASSCAYTVEFIVAGFFFLRYTNLRWTEFFVLQSADFRHYQKLLPKYSSR